MTILNAEQFRDAAAKRRKTADVEVPEVGTVRLRALSAGDAQRFQFQVQKAVKAGEDPEELAFLLIARSWVGEDGEPLMPEDEGVEVAKSLDPDVYNAIAAETLKLNGMSSDAVEEAAKNSEASRQESTPTGSPETSDTPT